MPLIDHENGIFPSAREFSEKYRLTAAIYLWGIPICIWQVRRGEIHLSRSQRHQFPSCEASMGKWQVTKILLLLAGKKNCQNFVSRVAWYPQKSHSSSIMPLSRTNFEIYSVTSLVQKVRSPWDVLRALWGDRGGKKLRKGTNRIWWGTSVNTELRRLR